MRVTYYIGAGASINAIPAVNQLEKRFEFFSQHLQNVSFPYKELLHENPTVEQEQKDAVKVLNEVALGIKNHYTVDTYAKKLFFKNDKQKLINLKQCLTAFFIYEQLAKNINSKENSFIRNKIQPTLDFPSEEDLDVVKKVRTNVDPRYDAFFATLLQEKNKSLAMPNSINVISWNYDFQFEIAYSNFSETSLNETEKQLNIFGALTQRQFDQSRSGIIKLNGTAGFISGNNDFQSLFDFKQHQLEMNEFDILKNTILNNDRKDASALRFAWIDNELSKESKERAKRVMEQTDIVVVIGYSFPYFNREVDRSIFEGLYNKSHTKVYLQVPQPFFQSISDRFEGVYNKIKMTPYTEVDQFLIPNEM